MQMARRLVNAVGMQGSNLCSQGIEEQGPRVTLHFWLPHFLSVYHAGG